jgi:hypothetical protein
MLCTLACEAKGKQHRDCKGKRMLIPPPSLSGSLDETPVTGEGIGSDIHYCVGIVVILIVFVAAWMALAFFIG